MSKVFVAWIMVGAIVASAAGSTAQSKPSNKKPAKSQPSWLKRMALPTKKPSTQAKRPKSPKLMEVLPLSPLPRALPGQVPDIGWNPDGITVRQTPGLLITTLVQVEDPPNALRALQIMTGECKGTAIRFDDLASSPDPEGAVLFVPKAKASEIESQLPHVGKVMVTSHSTGTNEERLAQIERSAKTHIQELEDKRDQQLIQYLQDATPVQITLESLSRLKKSISELRRTPIKEGYAVVWVRFT